MLAQDILHKDRGAAAPSRSAAQFAFLLLGKFSKCIGIFGIGTLAKQTHVVVLLFLMRLVSAAILLPVQKPFTTGKVVKRSDHVRVSQLAFLNILIELIWFYGITFCGPLRSILVFELNPKVVAIALEALFIGKRSPSQTRGIFCLFIGYLALLIMDEDSSVELNHVEAHSHQSGLNHMFYHVISWFGISHHKGGLVLLLIASCLRYIYDVQFRTLAVEIGGPKKLYSMVSINSTIFIFPLGVLTWIMTTSSYSSFFYFIFLAGIFATLVFIVDFFMESTCFDRMPQPVMMAARWAPVTIYSWAFLLSWLYYPVGPEGHAISSGVLVTIIAFSLASFILTNPSSTSARSGKYVGLSDEGKPLFIYGEAYLQRASQSFFKFCKEMIREILSNNDSKTIFYFLCVNLVFCGVEFFYGFINGSLGLISDGFHMLFDCTALVMGLVASVMARSTASKQFSFGYGRVEVLSGFINALFLIVIALMILLEALERLYNPPEVDTDKLMIVAILGLLVNLFGMYALHGGHDHGHGHSHGHHHHGHSHGHDHHGHSHGNANMEGVFLHVLADTLGSVFVIISTLLIQFFGWQWVDPFCSLILSMLILGSVFPLLKASASVLLQCVPGELSHELEHALEDVLNIEGVQSYSNLHAWQLKGEVNVVSMHLQLTDGANDQTVRSKACQIFKNAGIQHITVQVEKERFFRRIQNLIPLFRQPQRIEKGIHVVKHHDHNHHGHDHHDHNHGHDHHDHSHHDHDHGHDHSNHGHDHKHSHDHSHGHSHSHHHMVSGGDTTLQLDETQASDRGNYSFNATALFLDDLDKCARVCHDIFIDFHNVCTTGGSFAEVVERLHEIASDGVQIFDRISEGGKKGGKKVGNIKESLIKERNAFDLILKLHRAEVIAEESDDINSVLKRLFKVNIHFRKLVTLLHWSEEVAFADPIGFSQLISEVGEASAGHAFIDAVRKGNFVNVDSCFTDSLSESDLDGLDRIKRVFFCLLRCGRFKKLNELFEKTGLSSLKAFVQVREVLTNPNESPADTNAENYDFVEARLHFKNTANVILSIPEQTITPIDQCIWATLAGNLAILLAHAENPEDILWAYVNCAVESILDDEVVASHSVEDQEILEFMDSRIDIIQTIESVFQNVCNHVTDVYYKLIGFISSGMFDSAVNLMYDDSVGKEATDANKLSFYTHLILLIKSGDYGHDVNKSNAVIKEYVKVLSGISLYNCIPFYLSKLDETTAIEEMVNFLYSIQGKNARLEALEAASQLDVFDVGKLCIEVYKKAKRENPFDDGGASPESVAKLMDVWKFLLIYPEKTSIDALVECNNVLRGLFVRDRLGESMELLAISEQNLVTMSEQHMRYLIDHDVNVNHDRLIKFVQDQQREFNSYILYLEIMDKFTVWQGKVKAQLPRQPEKISDVEYARLDLASRSEYDRRMNLVTNHRASLDKYKKSVVEQINYLLSQTSTWMVCCLEDSEAEDREEQEKRRKQMTKVHERYLYYSLTMLITIHQESQQEGEALKVADLLMDSRYDLYSQLSKESLRKLIEQISKSGHVLSVKSG